jgi:hypothetical protein
MNHKSNLFVVIVGIAAWIHSTWSFSVVIGGDTPPINQWIDVIRWLYWIAPGAAAAAAVDVGLISLASQFRGGGGNRARLVTFGVLATISYLGQALFALSHGGRYQPSAGLSPLSVSVAGLVWEVLIWALPAALPVTLLLWAWADMQPASEAAALTVIDQPAAEPLIISTPPSALVATCEHCGKTLGEYETEGRVKAALRGHLPHCHVYQESR